MSKFAKAAVATALIAFAAVPAPAKADVNAPVVIGITAAAASALAIYATETDNSPLSTNTVPLAGFGVGGFDVLESDDQDSAVDFRFEYRFGEPMWYVFKPLIALQATSDGSGGAFAGVVADWLINDHWVIAPSFAAGFWGHGNGKDLGYGLEFRSQIEMGYRFDNDWRLTGAFSHISNADLGSSNPGVEIANIYLHIPADSILPR